MENLKPRYIPLEKLLTIKIKRYPSLYRGEYKRMKAIASLLTCSSVMWDKFGNLISTDTDIYCSENEFLVREKYYWEIRKQEKITEIKELKKKITNEQDIITTTTLKRILKRREETFKKYFTKFNPYQDEFENTYNLGETIQSWLRPNNTGYGVMEHIPNNAKDESLNIIKEYLDFVFEHGENISNQMREIYKNVKTRYRDSNIKLIIEE